MPRLLFVAYYYAPAAVVGTLRSMRFIKGLSNLGWDITILTIDESNYDLCDFSLFKEFDINCKVIRCNGIKNYNLNRVYIDTEWGGKIETRLNTKYYRPLSISNFLNIPDTKVGWIPDAIRSSVNLFNNNPFDAVLTTSYPYSSHLVGWYLKKVTGKPWVADFRDPWAEYAFLYPGTPVHRKIAAWLEKRVISFADAIIANTEAACKRFQFRYPNQLLKFCHIPNGFSQEHFNRWDSIRPPLNKFVITHAGTIFAGKDRRSPTTFLQAINKLLKTRPGLQKDLLVHFVGHIQPGSKLMESVEKLGLQDNLRIFGYLNHLQVTKILMESDILLLIHHSGEPIEQLYSTIPAKTYEYFGAKKPILCLSSAGVIKDLITNNQLGCCSSPQDVDGIIRALDEIFINYDKWCSVIEANEFILQYEAHSLAEKLSNLLYSII